MAKEYRVNDRASFYHGYAVKSVERHFLPAQSVHVHRVQLVARPSISFVVREDRLTPTRSWGF